MKARKDIGAEGWYEFKKGMDFGKDWEESENGRGREGQRKGSEGGRERTRRLKEREDRDVKKKGVRK